MRSGKRILSLSALDTLDADPVPPTGDWIIHNAIDRFIREAGDDGSHGALDRLLAIGEEEFAPWLDRPGIRAFWWPRFERIAEWIVALENDRASGTVRRHTEVDGVLTIDRDGRPFGFAPVPTVSTKSRMVATRSWITRPAPYRQKGRERGAVAAIAA